MAERIAQTMSHRAPQSPRRRKWSAAAALLICLLALSPLSALAAPAPGTNVASIAAAPNPGAFMTLDGAGADRDLGAGPSKDYMTVNLTLAQQAFVRVSFTGYAYAKSSAGGVITPGCPCLVRGELRANSEAKQIVTRTVVGTDGNDIAADPAATPAVAAADRRDFAGSHVFYVPAGSHTFAGTLGRHRPERRLRLRPHAGRHPDHTGRHPARADARAVACAVRARHAEYRRRCRGGPTSSRHPAGWPGPARDRGRNPRRDTPPQHLN